MNIVNTPNLDNYWTHFGDIVSMLADATSRAE
jgi:hypothetical protein